MDARKLIFNGVGILLGGGLMYALVKKSGYEKRAKTVSSVIVEGGAITGGALVGYHLSNLIMNNLMQEKVDTLPKEQATALPDGGVQPVETPSSATVSGTVAAKASAAAAVPTPIATQAEISGGQVIDITKARNNNEG